MAIYKTKLYGLKSVYDMTSGNKNKVSFMVLIVMAMSVFFLRNI